MASKKQRELQVDPLLKDILVENVDPSKFIFKKFKDRKDVMKNILDEFTSGRYSNSEEDERYTGYFISENDRDEVGVISYALTISTFVALLSQGELVSEVYTHHAEILYCFNNILRDTNYNENMISQRGETSNLIYSAEPYLFEKGAKVKSISQNTKISTFTDTMAKLLIAACDMRFYLMRCKDEQLAVDNFDYYLKAAEDLICLTMKDLTAAAIRLDTPIRFIPFATTIERVKQDEGEVKREKDKYDIEYKGWNFLSSIYRGQRVTEKDYGFSYYVTYTVCQAYTTVYNYFEWNIKECRNHRDYLERMKNENSSNLIVAYEPIEVPKDKARFFEESKEFIEKIFNPYFFPFSKTILDAGRYLNVRVYERQDLDIGKDFIGNDFNPVTSENIETSSTNDALFNTLFSFGIFLSSGIDLDYTDFGEAAKDKFFTDLNYGLINVDKCLRHLIKHNKEYIVRQNILAVWEKIPNEIDYFSVNAKKVRKRRIQVMTIIPLLISVHSEIAKFITKYPEREMSTYLRYIMDKRYRDEKGKPIWAWDDDGYDLNNTLLYIKALNSFYDYYELYEAPFYEKEVANKLAVKKIEDDAKKDVKDREAKIAELEEQIKALKQKDAITLALEGVISNYLDETLKDHLIKLFKNEISKNSIKDQDQKYSPFYGAFLDMMFSCIIDPVRSDSDLKITTIDESNGGYKIDEAVANKLIESFREMILESLKDKAIEAYNRKQEKGVN